MKVWIALFVALLFVAQPAAAKKEFREIAWSWCLWDCGNSGEYESPAALFEAMNAYIDQTFDQCVASTSECRGSCYKINRWNPAPAGGFAIFNGTSTFQTTRSNFSTSFTPSCGGNPSQTLVTDIGGASVAAYGRTHCPAGWSFTATSYTYVSIDGQQTPTAQTWCELEIPEPPPVPPKTLAPSQPVDGIQACPIRSKPLFGDPIDPVDGIHVQAELDYSSADGSLRIDRFYSSSGGGRWTWGDVGMSMTDFTGRTGAGAGGANAPFVAEVFQIPPGFYWGQPRPPAVAVQKSFPLLKTQPASANEVSITLKDGRRLVFQEMAPGMFSTSSISKESLSVSTLPDGTARWVLRTSAGEYVFDASGEVIQRVFPDGRVTNYLRQPGSVTVTSLPSTRSIVYSRDLLLPRYSSATLPDGLAISYDMDSMLRVKGVTYPDGTSKSYLHGEANYTGGYWPSWLTGLVDENGVRTATFKYTGSQALSTERSGGVDKYSVSYNGALSIVTAPNGGPSYYLNWERGPDGERRLVSQSQPAGAGCAASSSSRTFDANGNLASSNDFNGYRTCFASDAARNLQTTRVEGLASGASCTSVTAAGATLPAGSRKTTIEWHPDWPLKTRISEPGRLTSNVYNGQPDPFNGGAVATCAPAGALLPDGKPIAVLCKQVEQATSDANGAMGFSATLQPGLPSRQTTWTYNQWGQVLTEDGPRTDVNDITTYAYYDDTTADHMPGDLQSVTTAAGKVTTYTRYNRHGQLLESSDPNGAVTSNTYDLRQRLLSTTIGGQTTSYQYDPVGQLKKVTLPDQSWIGYDYDDAHRQVAVYDNRGNRVDYTLDNAGNRIGEQTKDPSGALKRQLSRSIDALGRVQQTTGRE
ncbi:MAG: RHS repeat protein [Planctomycetes bacterium]|nr:RHS repeat protein [Planctomycetota bacterium]